MPAVRPRQLNADAASSRASIPAPRVSGTRRRKFRPLHLLNPLRTQFVAERVALEGVRVLDVGCGGGLLAESLARAGAQVTAIDLAPGMIEVARLHAAESGLASTTGSPPRRSWRAARRMRSRW